MSKKLRDIISYPESQIYTTVHSYAKVYPDFTRVLTFHQPRQQRVPGFESQTPENNQPRSPSNKPEYFSLSRTKTKVRDIVYCNDFDFFCTFTFGKDRENIDLCRSRMQKWLKAQSQKHGAFGYIILPEWHKNKKAIHFHALLKGYNGRLQYSGVKQRGRKVYNALEYQLGFSTIVPITKHETDRQAVALYITKYITKDMPHFKGHHKYWTSKGLKRPKKYPNPQLTSEFEKHLISSYTGKHFEAAEYSIIYNPC